jgi:hypothetical protein
MPMLGLGAVASIATVFIEANNGAIPSMAGSLLMAKTLRKSRFLGQTPPSE